MIQGSGVRAKESESDNPSRSGIMVPVLMKKFNGANIHGTDQSTEREKATKKMENESGMFTVCLNNM